MPKIVDQPIDESPEFQEMAKQWDDEEPIVVVFVLRDGNEREFFHAFDEDAAWDAETEAMLDRRFGGPRDVVFATLQEEG